MRYLPLEEVHRLLDACEDEQLRVILDMVGARGMRRGEIRGLRWRDVDFASGSAHVARSAQSLDGSTVTFTTPKTARSRRNVALSDETVRVLREHRARQLENRLKLGPGYRDQDLVFARVEGDPLLPSSVTQRFKTVAKRSGPLPLRFHDLRHTAATLMLLRNVNPKVVSERLGHSRVSFTLDKYSHVLPDMQREAAATMDEVLARPS